MKEILNITDTDAIGLTQDNRIVSVKKDGSGYSVVSTNATEEEISAWIDRTFLLDAQGKLTVGETVYSERAVAAATDGLILYWVNKGENGYVLMQKELPGKEQEAFGRVPVSVTGRSVPEPICISVTTEALTLTAADRSIIVISMQTGDVKSFPASGQMTIAACMAGDRLYRYIATETSPYVLETIQNDAMQLSTVTPAPTNAPTATPAPTPRVTLVPTATPRSSSGGSSETDYNIYKGARGNTVRKIQRRLQDLGYPVGSVDGVYGEQTQIAVNLFYDAIHVRERSYITPSMRNRLFASNAPEYDPYMPLQKGDRGLSVTYMQMMLRKLGYDPIKIDGIYGELTIKAVAEYQKAIGYKCAEKEIPGEYASHDLLEQLLGPEKTPEPTATPTATPVPTNTPAATNTPAPTNTPVPTNTPKPATNTDL